MALVVLSTTIGLPDRGDSVDSSVAQWLERARRPALRRRRVHHWPDPTRRRRRQHRLSWSATPPVASTLPPRRPARVVGAGERPPNRAASANRSTTPSTAFTAPGVAPTASFVALIPASRSWRSTPAARGTPAGACRNSPAAWRDRRAGALAARPFATWPWRSASGPAHPPA